jgi:ATP-dependent Clp endopeptidase proteolytic subunit ClpP
MPKKKSAKEAASKKTAPKTKEEETQEEQSIPIEVIEESETDKQVKLQSIIQSQAEVKKVEAETRRAEAEALKAEVESRKVWSAFQKELNTDEENYVYRFSRDVNESSVSACMKKLTEWHRKEPECAIEVIFSSPGGSIIDGFELFDFLQNLRNQGHHVTTGSLGMAASMAGILLQAGDVRWIGHQSWMMIHRAAFGAIGKTYEIEDEVMLVKRIEDRILDIFTSRSKLSQAQLRKNWDRKDWWIDADECKKLGLVDQIKAMMPEHLKAPKKRKPRKKSIKKKK